MDSVNRDIVRTEWCTLLTHWGRVMHICVGKLTIIGSDNGLSHGRRQAIIWTNAGILLIWSSGTNFSEILTEIHTFSFKKMFLNVVRKMAAILSLPPWAITSRTQLYNGNQQSRSWQRAFSISQKASDCKTLQSLEGTRARLNIKCFPGMGIRDCLIFNMGIPILVRRHFYTETAPWSVVMILPIALKCGRRLGSTAAEAPVRPTFCEILQ